MVGQKEEVRGPSLDLHEGQTGPCSSIRLAVSNTQSLALGANVMSVVGQCHLRPQCSEGAVSLKLDPALALNSRSLPRSQLSVTMGFSLARPLSLALALSFLPVCSPILPASFPTPPWRLVCQLCKPPSHVQPVYQTQRSSPPHLIQVIGVSWKSQPVLGTCPRNKRGGELMEPPNALPHGVKQRELAEHP